MTVKSIKTPGGIEAEIDMRILYGTGNAGKLAVMRRKLAGLGLEVSGPADMEKTPPKAEENGRTLLENARLKAKAYYEVYRMPVLACDTSLHFLQEGFPEELQPGVYTRRVRGKVLSDEEMITYYGELAKRFGGLRARYENAVCFYLDETHIYECDKESLWGREFVLTNHLHEKYQPGFPLDGLSVEAESGISYYELSEEARDEIAVGEGIKYFFKDVLQQSKINRI